MKQLPSILIAALLALGLGACGEQQKPAAKAPTTSGPAKPTEAAPASPTAEPAKPAEAAPASPTATASAPAAPAGEMKKEEKK